MNYDSNSSCKQKFQQHRKTNFTQPIFNLMEEKFGAEWINRPEKYFELDRCSIEYANAEKLQQDHPCVLLLIRKQFLRQPTPRSQPYLHLFDNGDVLDDPSDGQSKGILRILHNQTNGFFIECGSYDGEFLSNTLFMERSLNWSGLLIEADKKAFRQLSSRKRKAYTAPVCLSTRPYPMQVLYNITDTLLGSIVDSIEDFQTNSKINLWNETEHVYRTQCFPLYSLLLAVGTTTVDYFSLDVEGSEYKILYTIPWHKVDIKTLTVEWDHTPEGEDAISRLMEDNKYIKFGKIAMSYSNEIVYVKDFLYDLRLYE